VERFELGQRVICSSYVKKSGNHYETDKDRDTFCEFWATGATRSIAVEDFHSCDLLVRIPASFRGVYVGTTHRATRLSVEYDEPPYGKAGFYFSKDESRPFAIVYYADNKKRLVPMDAIWTEEKVKTLEEADEKKPLKNWTLGECKEYCENERHCIDCPLISLCDEWGFGTPQNWPLGG